MNAIHNTNDESASGVKLSAMPFRCTFTGTLIVRRVKGVRDHDDRFKSR